MVDVEYLKMTALQKFCYRGKVFLKQFPKALKRGLLAVPRAFCASFRGMVGVFSTLSTAFLQGDWKTKTSFFVMGFSHLARGQILRGLLYLLFQIIFFAFLLLFGWKYLAKLGSLGEVAMLEEWDELQQMYVYKYYDNSLLILLYSLLTLFFIVSFFYVYYHSVKGGFLAQERKEAKQRLATAKEDISAYADRQYHQTLLAMPLLGLTVFTIFPIIFMVLIAFTNYDIVHTPPKELFSWVGLENFITVFGGGITQNSAKFAFTFRELLLWTVTWAFFATFTNYILGMIVAIMINKKGIRLKKLWRTVLVTTIAVPQFVSLMLMSQMLKETGIVNYLLQSFGVIEKAVPFLTDGTVAKITVVLVNIWIGIPFTMLICTGILMNIPADLYESAKIDGSGAVRTYFKITLPYMLHVTTPYLISQFIGNINNFNVIFLLTGGNPLTLDYQYAGKTDLLITWLYKLTFNEGAYGVASVISILLFILIASFSLILYNRSNAVKNEEEFM